MACQMVISLMQPATPVLSSISSVSLVISASVSLLVMHTVLTRQHATLSARPVQQKIPQALTSNSISRAAVVYGKPCLTELFYQLI